MPTSPPTLRGDDAVDAIPPNLAFNAVGVLTLLGWLFWMIATGRLVTRREHENRVGDKDKVIADKDAQIVMYRGASETKDAQLSELLEQGRLSIQLMEALEERSRRGESK